MMKQPRMPAALLPHTKLQPAVLALQCKNEGRSPIALLFLWRTGLALLTAILIAIPADVFAQNIIKGVVTDGRTNTNLQ